MAQLSKFLPNSTKEQQAYKAQRMQTTMLYGGMDAVASAAGRNGPPTDPIAAALAAHGDGVQHKKKHSINPANFFSANYTWR